MIKHKYDSSGYRPLNKEQKIIDIGGANSYAYGYLDAIIDIRIPQAVANHVFVCDIDMPESWNKILEHVKQHGKWDYAICTHTLEDINNPLFASQMIERIAKAGLLVFPSKYREFARFSGPFRGFAHHKWIFDVIDGELIAFPKFNFIEEPEFDNLHQGLPGREEIVIEWSESIGMKQVNDGMPFGTSTLSGDQHMRELYYKLLC